MSNCFLNLAKVYVSSKAGYVPGKSELLTYRVLGLGREKKQEWDKE